MRRARHPRCIGWATRESRACALSSRARVSCSSSVRASRRNRADRREAGHHARARVAVGRAPGLQAHGPGPPLRERRAASRTRTTTGALAPLRATRAAGLPPRPHARGGRRGRARDRALVSRRGPRPRHPRATHRQRHRRAEVRERPRVERATTPACTRMACTTCSERSRQGTAPRARAHPPGQRRDLEASSCLLQATAIRPLHIRHAGRAAFCTNTALAHAHGPFGVLSRAARALRRAGA